MEKSRAIAEILRDFTLGPGSSGVLATFCRWEVEGLLMAPEQLVRLERTERAELQARAALAHRKRDRIERAALDVASVFDDEGIDIVAMKGLSTGRYYLPEDGERWFGDADLFVPDLPIETGSAALTRLGVAPRAAQGAAELAAAGHLGAILFYVDGVEIDLHFVPTGQLARYPRQRRTYDMRELTELDGLSGPSLEFDLVIAVVNTVRDVGWSLKSATDAVQILRRCAVDWSAYERIAAEFGMERVCGVGLGLILEQLAPELQGAVPDELRTTHRFISLANKRSMLTPKRGAVSGLYFGPGRIAAGVALLRWIVPGRSRMYSHVAMDQSTSYATLLRRLQEQRVSKAISPLRRS